VTLISVQVGLQSCGNDDPAPNDVTQQILTAGKWNIQSATIDGVSTDLFTNLTLSFDTNNPIYTYTTTNGGVVWPASGTWSFVGEDGKKIKRNDGLDIDLENVSDKQLVISYTWASTTFTGGRIKGIKGVNKLTFTR